MTTAHYLAIWAGLDRQHAPAEPSVPELPEHRIWIDGRWRAAFNRTPATQEPRHRLPVAARRRHVMPRVLAR